MKEDKMEAKELMNLIDDVDCHAEVCFTDSKGQRRALGWAQRLIEISFKAGQREVVERIKQHYFKELQDLIKKLGL